MKCKTCNADIEPNPKGRKKLYCSSECQPYGYKPKGAGLSHCQVCGKSLANIGAGRPKRNCSNLCRNRAQLHKKHKPKSEMQCLNCGSSFYSNNGNHRFCSHDCRYSMQKKKSSSKWQAMMQTKYPDRTRTVNCGWCGEPRTFKIGESVANAYHSECSKEAQRARYRIKTVKRRNKLVKPSRLAADEVFRIYGPNCHICELPIDHSLPRTSKQGLTVDHVIPLSRGGVDTIDNLRPAHWSCNMRKSNKTMEELNA
jgi:5-methylcytosine-specific restriction endonuclease McrA